jgi:hypothetical protein
MKFIHSPLRNRLSEDRVDKLQYILLNSRVLRRVPERRKPEIDVGDWILKELEELALRIENDVVEGREAYGLVE